MKQPTEYAGIDYGLGRSNIDNQTGIRFGVISQYSVMPEALDDFYTHGKDIAYDVAVSDLQAEFKNDPEGLEMALEELNCAWETNAGNLLYDRDGYRLTGCLDNDLFVLRSPYYTHAQFCSPCVPGAGNLDCPLKEGPNTWKTGNESYCLGHDWFQNGKAPYPIFSVETGERIMPENEETRKETVQ